MSTQRCEELFEKVVAYSRGELTPEDRGVVERHLEICERCRESVELGMRLNSLVEGVFPDPISVRRLEVAIAAGRVKGHGKRTRRRVTVPAVAAAAVAAVFVVWGGIAAWYLLTDTEKETASAPEISDDVTAPVAERPVQAVETSDEQHAIEMLEKTTVWVQKRSSVEVVENSGDLAKIRLKRGSTVIRRGAHSPAHRVVVVTPSAEIEAFGTIFSVEVAEDGAERTRVVEGKVVLRWLANGSKYVLSEGEELTLGSLKPRPARPEDLGADRCVALGVDCYGAQEGDGDPEARDGESSTARGTAQSARETARRAREAIDKGEFDDAERLLSSVLLTKLRGSEGVDLMVRLARAYRRERRFEMAADTYERLESRFPGSRAAVNGLVALAQIEQDTLGRSAIALVHFDRYLEREPGGPLAEPARAGRVRALFKLGRYREAVVAADDYLVRHGGGVSAAEVSKKRELAIGRL